jgi:integrase
MDEFTPQHLMKFITEHRKTHANGSVNRVVIIVRYMFNLAIRWNVAGVKSNPTANVPLLEEHNYKERFLTADETASLLTHIKQSDNPMLQYIIPMLIMTGARKREVLDLEWSAIDLEQRQWRLAAADNKSKKVRYIPLSEGVLQILASVPRFDNCPYVFPNEKTLKPYVSFFCSWNTARKAAGLTDVRVHDLRHSFASFLVNAGCPIYEVKELLGHSQIKTTQRYAHLSQNTLLNATNKVSAIMAAANDALMPQPAQQG